MIAIMSPKLCTMLARLRWTTHGLAAGTRLFHAGDPVHALHLVETGVLRLIRRRASGEALTLQTAREGDLFAEASLTAATYHCDGEALTASSVRSAPVAAVRALLAEDPTAAMLWIAHLGAVAQAARMRLEILALRTVAERLDAWLDWRGGVMPAKGAWRGLAEEIGVSPEALYREIARRRQRLEKTSVAPPAFSKTTS